MTSKGNTEVIKKPLDVEPVSRPQQFPRMPRLYLELIENKGKIKQDLIDKEFILSDNISVPHLEPISPQSDISDDDMSVESFKPEEKHDTLLSDDASIGNLTVKSRDSTVVSQVESIRSADVSIKSDDGLQDLDKRLNDMLAGSDDESASSTVVHKKKNKYSKQRDRHGHSIQKTTSAPSFAELEAKGAYIPKKELRDVNVIHPSEKEDEDLKRELLFKFELLRKSYPSASIPIYTIHTEYQTMLNSYDDCVRRLSLDSSVESYKQYLIYGFMGVEFIFGKFLKLDMEGFTQQQIVSMTSYEKLLIELGEKSYVPEGSKWSVEVRLGCLVMMNAAFFIVSKMIMSKTSVNLMNMMNGMTKKTQGTADAPKRKMKGPDLDLDDIPEI